MHISNIIKIPKTILGIVAAVSAAIVGFIFLPAIWFWICWEVVAAALVAIGCFGEWYLFKTPTMAGEEARHRRRELQFIFMVAIGVTMELFALAHAIPETLQLERDVAEANKRAAKAQEAASLANERAAVAEKQLAEIKIKALPRRISEKQRDDFIRLTKGSPKAPVRVIAMTEDKETMDYAHHIREILDAAGFGNSSNKVECLARSYVVKVISPIDDLNKDMMLSVAFHNTLNKLTWPGIKFIEEETRIGSVYDPQDSRALPAIINIAFADIGIKTGWACLPFYLKPGEWAIVVPQKF